MLTRVPKGGLDESLEKSAALGVPRRRFPLLVLGNFLASGVGSRAVGYELTARLVETGWNVTRASSRSSRVGRVLDMLVTIFRQRENYELAVVEVYSGRAFIWAELVCAALRSVKRPYVLMLHGGNLPAFGTRWPRRVRRMLSSAAAVSAPSRYLIEAFRGARPDIELIRNPVDLTRYRGRERSAARPNLVWLRAFHRTYQPEIAPMVLARLLPEFPHAHLTMIGPDKGDGSLDRTRGTARALGVSRHVTILPAVAKHAVPSALERGDIFLNTSRIDNAPVSVVEAQACGLCVVSTNVGGLPFHLIDEEDALLVPPGDAPRMAAAVARIARCPSLAAHLSRNGMASAGQYDWRQVLPVIERVLGAARNGAAST